MSGSLLPLKPAALKENINLSFSTLESRAYDILKQDLIFFKEYNSLHHDLNQLLQRINEDIILKTQTRSAFSQLPTISKHMNLEAQQIKTKVINLIKDLHLTISIRLQLQAIASAPIVVSSASLIERIEHLETYFSQTKMPDRPYWRENLTVYYLKTEKDLYAEAHLLERINSLKDERSQCFKSLLKKEKQLRARMDELSTQREHLKHTILDLENLKSYAQHLLSKIEEDYQKIKEEKKKIEKELNIKRLEDLNHLKKDPTKKDLCGRLENLWEKEAEALYRYFVHQDHLSKKKYFVHRQSIAINEEMRKINQEIDDLKNDLNQIKNEHADELVDLREEENLSKQAAELFSKQRFLIWNHLKNENNK